MPIEPEILAENAYWCDRLAILAGRLSDEDLAQPMAAGWTPAAVLAHMAFWDIRIVTLLRQWESAGEVSASPVDSDVINEVTRRLLLAIPPRAAAEMALEWAQAANQAILNLSPEVAAEVRAKAPNTRLDRAHHRKAHIEEIEKLLGI
jgi:hypothetical protein